MSTTEGGRKVTAAVASTGRAVATTSRAVGGALTQARGALSGWWSALTAPAAPPDVEVETADVAADHLDDNRTRPPPDLDPPDKSIEDAAADLGKIRVV